MPEPADGSVIPMIPQGSSALREFCHAIEDALTLAAPATTKDELTYLRISRDRARVVLFGCKQVLADHELDDLHVRPADKYTRHADTPGSTGQHGHAAEKDDAHADLARGPGRCWQ